MKISFQVELSELFIRTQKQSVLFMRFGHESRRKACMIPDSYDNTLLIKGLIYLSKFYYVSFFSGDQYVFKVRSDILIGELRKQAIETYNLREIDFINHGLYLPPEGGKKGKFLQNERTISDYPQLVATKLFTIDKNDGNYSEYIVHETDNNRNGATNDGKCNDPVLLELLPKIRYVEEYRVDGSKINKRIQSKHNQKRLLSAIKRNDIPRVTDLLDQGLDPNFQHSSSGATPLEYAAELSDPREMILQLVNAGAHLDYRDGDTMTALHRAAIWGNLKAIEVFLELGQNPNIRDNQGLTPLYYACSEDIPPGCIKRLLFDHAILGITDDKGRQEIHQACLNGRKETLEQLIIYGADLNAQVENHNTPIHLCILADEVECLKLLLRCGASTTIVNSSGQTPYELAVLIERMYLANILQNFDEKSVKGIDKTPVYNKDRRPTIHGPRAVFDIMNFSNHHHSNTMTIGKLRNCLSVDSEMTHHKYNRCLSFDYNRLTTRIGNEQYNDRYGQTVYSRSNSLGGHTKLWKLSQLRQHFPNSRIRSVTLERGISGYGFIMQGTDTLKGRYSNSVSLPTQHIMSVQPDSKADKAGLIPGDYLIEINGTDVFDSPHTEVVHLISSAQDLLTLKIINLLDKSEMNSKVSNGDHSNKSNSCNNSNSSSNSGSSTTTANTNISNSRTSFISVDLRRRSAQRSASLHTITCNHDDQEKIICTHITTNFDNNHSSNISNSNQNNKDHTDGDNSYERTLFLSKHESPYQCHYRPYNNNNNIHDYGRSTQALYTDSHHFDKKSRSLLIIMKNESEQLHETNRTSPLLKSLSSPSSSTSVLENTSKITTTTTTSSITITMANSTYSNGSGISGNKLIRTFSETEHFIMSKPYQEVINTLQKTPQSTIILYDQQFNEQKDEQFIQNQKIKSLSLSRTSPISSIMISTLPSFHLSSTKYGQQEHQNTEEEIEVLKQLKKSTQYAYTTHITDSSNNNNVDDNGSIHNHETNRVQYEDEQFVNQQPYDISADKWDSSWDSESDLVNISELTEISENSLKPERNSYTTTNNNNNNDNNSRNQGCIEEKQQHIEKQRNNEESFEERKESDQSPDTRSSLLLKENEINTVEFSKMNIEVNGIKMKTYPERYVQHITVKNSRINKDENKLYDNGNEHNQVSVNISTS
ncbi:unnamed protein product [Heterobilharzia americana]|nr:unnamed protein product [Heterobilharzia americana]